MLRHHSLGPAELAALMGAWRPLPAAQELRFRRILAFDVVAEEAKERDADQAEPSR